MNKAFIFDMDGVIINSETAWEKHERKFLTKLVGESVYEKIKGELLGSTPQVIYKLACQYGTKIEKELFFQKYDEEALLVYRETELTQNINILLQKLKSLNFKVGLVTSSPELWIKQVISRLKNKDIFECILSLAQRQDLRPKPYPDGYLEVIKKLKSAPKNTIILEDSNKGIQAAKASKAFTICLRENLQSAYIPKGADMYIDNLNSLFEFLSELKQ